MKTDLFRDTVVALDKQKRVGEQRARRLAQRLRFLSGAVHTRLPRHSRPEYSAQQASFTGLVSECRR
jgi:hypothetical protein